MTIEARELSLQAADGHRWQLPARLPSDGALRGALLWLPALGVSARNYLPFAEALATRGIATFVHEWRGFGSSTWRAGHDCDWGYRELLLHDIPASAAAMAGALPEGTVRRIGGHSLGGQLACCRLGLAPDAFDGAWLVASGAPYWRAFPWPWRAWLPAAYRAAPWLADRCGALPGKRLRFGGQEARGVIRDWARTALSGRYAGRGIDADLEAGMRTVRVPVDTVVFDDDWLAPPSSMRFLLSKLSNAPTTLRVLDRDELGVRASHFPWLQSPAGVVDALLAT